MSLLEALAAIALVIWVLNDVFTTVILPRPAPARFRPAGLLTRWSWRLWRRYADGSRTADRREQRLGIFAPAIVMTLLGLWIVLLIVGFGLGMHSLSGDFSPPLPDLGTALYVAAVSLLTIGYGDFVPGQPLARAVSVAAGGVGLGIVALTITYLFSLYANFQRRELQVVTLDARAGAPPSGTELLVTCAAFDDDTEELGQIFEEWERWSAEVLESHLAYPILMFFRSTHDHESWVSAIGAVLDAATLMLTTVEGGPRGQATATRGIGAHLVEDIARFFRFIVRDRPVDGAMIERAEFDDARLRLQRAGYVVMADADRSWSEFARLRSEYAGPLNQLAQYLDVPPAQWIGDRSTLRH
ncbi:MAG: potassium channel family protein [Chloroflexota bacterium]|nr:potassium channel family protein [Chloroflexota bacterium]